MNHLMVDIETFGVIPGAVIRSIGAVVFDPRSDYVGGGFYVNITEEDQLAAGAFKEDQAVSWWARQSQEAQNKFLSEQKSVLIALSEFRKFYSTQGIKYVWSQGSNYDSVLLENLMRRFNFSIPWKYNDTRDTRTAYDMAKFNSYAVERTGVYHSAYDDALHQIKCVQAAFKKLRSAESN